MKVLCTGGAGFIGSWTVDLLIKKGHDVTIMDNLQSRVHPLGPPKWLSKNARFIQADVTDAHALDKALQGNKAVIHLAAYQDYMPDFSNFIRTNAESSALLFELIVKDPKRYPVHKIVFASSQAVCGEGYYNCENCGPFIPEPRSIEQLKKGEWDIRCPWCHDLAKNLPIPETVCSPGTAYGISKYSIELLADRLGKRYDIPSACMRYTYVQGARNSFHNAYSGIARRFALQIISGVRPTVFEDGGQLRDYVNVKDVAMANVLALENPDIQGVYNIGGERAVSVLEFANLMLKEFNSSLEPNITGEFRVGDTRHTISDIKKIKKFGWSPTIQVEQNVKEYVEWLNEQRIPQFNEELDYEMRNKGVIRKANG